MTLRCAEILGIYGDDQESRALLVGPRRSGATSMAFAAAQDLANASTEKDRSVWFFCLRSKVELSLPLFVRTGTSLETDAWESNPDMERVSMKYFSSASDIKWWSLRVQELQPTHPLPVGIVVDDFDALLSAEAPASSEAAQRTVLHFVSLLKHAVSFIEAQSSSRCPLIICFSEASIWHKDVRAILEREVDHNVHEIRQNVQPNGAHRAAFFHKLRPGTETPFAFVPGTQSPPHFDTRLLR